MKEIEYRLLQIPGITRDLLEPAVRATQIHVLAQKNFIVSTDRLIDGVAEYGPQEMDTWTRLVALMQKIAGDSRYYRKSESLCDEFVRRLLTGEANGYRCRREKRGFLYVSEPCKDGSEGELTFVDAFRFVKTLREYKSLAYKALFDVVEGKGDDGFGDFIDALILAGTDVYFNVCQKVYHPGDWERLQNDINRCVGTVMGKVIIDGENYIEMHLKDKIRYFMPSWVRELSED